MPLFKQAWAWVCGTGPFDLGHMNLDNPHVRMLMYLGEQRTKRDLESRVVSGPTIYGDRVVEAREQRVQAMKRGQLTMMRGGRR